MSTAAPAVAEQVIDIPLDDIVDSPFNPRTSYPEAELVEMAATMRPPGRVLQPIIVRPRVDHAGIVMPNAWETVFGHRRRRAAGLAELLTIPAIVRDLTDEQAKLAQVVENLQREGVKPLEEADALLSLQRDHGATIETLMKHAGKSRSYVYGRLRLASAHWLLRDAVKQGGSPEIAQEVARRPQAMHEAAWHAVGHMSVRDAKAELERAWQFDLKRAPFDVLSIKLVEEAGACDACPKCSSNEEVLADEYGPGVCMDGACYGRKSQAARAAEEAERRAAQEREEARLLAEAAKPKIGQRWRVRPNAKGRGKTAGREGTVDSIRGKQVTLRWGPKSHQVGTYPLDQIERVVESAQGGETVGEAAKQFAWPFPGPVPGSSAGASTTTDDDEDEPTSPEERAVLDQLSWHRIRVACMRRVASMPRTTDDLRTLLARELELGDSDFGMVAEEVMGWGLDLDSGSDDRLAKLKTMTADQLGALLVINALQLGPISHSGKDDLVARRMEWAASYGVDIMNPDVQTPAPTPSTAARARGGAAKGKGVKAAKGKPAAASSKTGKTKKVKDNAAGAAGGEEDLEAAARDTKTADLFGAPA